MQNNTEGNRCQTVNKIYFHFRECSWVRNKQQLLLVILQNLTRSRQEAVELTSFELLWRTRAPGWAGPGGTTGEGFYGIQGKSYGLLWAGAGSVWWSGGRAECFLKRHKGKHETNASHLTSGRLMITFRPKEIPSPTQMWAFKNEATIAELKEDWTQLVDVEPD